MGAREVKGGAASSFRAERAVHRESRQPGRFSFFREGCRAKEPGPDRHARRPLARPRKRRDPGTEEPSVLAMVVQAAAHRDRQPRPDVNVVLYEHTGRRKGIPEVWHVGRLVAVTLDRHAADPDVRPNGSTHGHFHETRVMTIAFEHLPKPVVVPLARQCGSS